MNVIHLDTAKTGEPTATRRIDVTEMYVDGVAEYTHTQLDDAAVHLERRGSKTYLVAEGVR